MKKVVLLLVIVCLTWMGSAWAEGPAAPSFYPAWGKGTAPFTTSPTVAGPAVSPPRATLRTESSSRDKEKGGKVENEKGNSRGKAKSKGKDRTKTSGDEEDSATEEEPSAVELAMAETAKSVEKGKAQPQQFTIGNLTQFGYSFFNHESEEFESQTDIPVGPEYLIGPGDQLILTVWGSFDGTFELEVNRSGEVVLPKVGAVKVAGTRFGELPSLLKGRLAHVYRDFHLNLNLGKLRLINVYVVGEVNAPGDYQLNSLSTVISALAAAGGPTKKGSLRNIRITRNGKVIENLDLYDFFLKGELGKEIRLQPGDTIVVPLLGPVAGVAGNVRRPAIYELKGERTLKDLLSLAGGVSPSGYLQRVRCYRVDAHDKKVAEDFNLDPRNSGSDSTTAAILLRDHDLVEVFPIDTTLRGYVRLEGYVLRPGDYALKPGMRLSSLLAEDNLLPQYYAKAGEITRLYAPDYHPEVIYFDLSRVLAHDPQEDPELKEFDKVRIYSRKDMEELPRVKVSGEVQRPGDFDYFPHMTVRDLLMRAGNPKLTAFTKNAEISRVRHTGDGVSFFSIQVDLAEAMRGDPRHNIKLEPFDELSVRRIPNWTEEGNRYVTLKGEFVFPGVYPIYRGERLSSVISRAGGFTSKAFLPGAKFTREQVREIQQNRMDEILAKTEMDLATKESQLVATSLSQESQEASKAALEGLRKTVEYLKQKKAEGRLVIRLSSPETLKGSEYDLEVQGKDVIEVPSDPQMVSVYGQVYNPSSFVYLPGRSIDSYLKKSGGPTREADDDAIYLIKADGSVESKETASFFNSFLSKRIDSGDTLVVPQRVEKVAWMRDLKDIATILGQLAITAGVIIAAGL